MKIYYEFSQDLQDLDLLFISEKNNQVYKSIHPMSKDTKISEIKPLIDWINKCMEDAEAL
jgi:hypothetical protein